MSVCWFFYYSYYAESLLPPRNGICGYCTYDMKISEALYIKFSYLFKQQSSQNHRMEWVGRDLWRSSSPNSLLEQDHLEQVAQDGIQAGFEYLQRRRLHNLSGQPVPVLGHPQSKVFPHIQMELPVFQFVPIAPCPVTGHR